MEVAGATKGHEIKISKMESYTEIFCQLAAYYTQVNSWGHYIQEG
jgi:hypothetical protein